MKNKKYNFVIDMDERGTFACHVESDNAPFETVYKYNSDNGIPDQEPDSFCESSPIEDGFIKSWRDMDGLTSYLIDIGAIAEGSRIVYLG